MSSIPEKKLPFKGREMTQKKIPVSKLDMDLQNPRLLHDADSQDDAMTKMLLTTGEKCMELLRDLTMTGELSSSDLPIVVANQGRFTVLEGNRRLLCLRLWKNPRILSKLGSTGLGYSTRVTSYVSRSPYLPPKTIDVVIAADRLAAHDWIDKRHGLGSGGAGTVNWGSFQKDRRKAQSNPKNATLGYSFASFVMDEWSNESDLQQRLWDAIANQYTLFQRVFVNAAFRKKLGITFTSGAIRLEHGLMETKPALHKLIDDLASERENSRTLHDSTAIEQYAVRLYALITDHNGSPYSGSPKTSNSGVTSNSPGDTESESATGDSSKKDAIQQQNGSGTHRPSPPTRVFDTLTLPGFSTRIQRILKQTSILSVKKYPDVSAIMLRVLLDLTCYQFLELHDNQTPPKDLKKRVLRALEVLDPQVKQALGQVETTPPLRRFYREAESSPDLTLVNYAVHSGTATMTSYEIEILAERFEPMLVAMSDKMMNTKES